MKLEQLQQILEIKKYKSISKAAKALYMSQSTLSASIGKLEKEIGVSIFKRTTTGVELTEDGDEILNLAKQVLDGCGAIMDYSKKKDSGMLTGSVDLLMVGSFNTYFVEIQLRFQEMFPNAQLNMIVLEKEMILDELIMHKGSIGLKMELKAASGGEQDVFLNRHIIRKFKPALYVSPNHPFCRKECISLKDLRDEQFVDFTMGHWNRRNTLIHATKKPYLVPDKDSAMKLIVEGKGIGLFTDIMARDNFYYKEGLVRILPLEDAEGCTGVAYVLSPKYHALSLLEQKTIAMRKDIIQQEIE